MVENNGIIYTNKLINYGDLTMIDFKKMNLQTLGHLVVLGLLLLVTAYLVTTIISPLLVTIGLMKTGLTLTDTFLLLIAIKLYAKA